MSGKEKAHRRDIKAVISALTLIAAALCVVSCASGSNNAIRKSTTVKKPPGITQSVSQSSKSEGSDVSEAAGDSSKEEVSTEETAQENDKGSSATTPKTSVNLLGVIFTVINATRPDSNSSVISSSSREVKGDYLEIELEITNSSADLAQISDYAFRLSSPGIVASNYYDYYGDIGLYGRYVSSHVISGTLLDYSTLNSVSGKLKIGETLSDVFLFFDLNPKRAGKNPNVTKENTELVIKKVSGSGYGTTVRISLTGYPDK